MPHLVQLGPYPPPEGGVTRNLLGIHSEALDRGWHSSIIATTRSESRPSNTSVYRPRTPLALADTLRSLKGDVVHLHLGGTVNARVLALAGTVAALSRSSVLSIHSGSFALSRRSSLARPASVRGNIFRKFGHIISVSEEINEVLGRYGIAGTDRSVISPFIPSDPDPAVTLSLAADAFLNEHSPVFLNIGGLELEYDPFFQLDVFAELRKSFPGSGLMFVGGGSMESEIAERIHDGTGKADVFLAGNMPHHEALHAIKKSDVVLRTTKFDGDAISVRESIYLGKPVVASDVAKRPAEALTYKAGDLAGCVEKVRAAIACDEIHAHNSYQRSNIDQTFAVYERLIRAR